AGLALSLLTAAVLAVVYVGLSLTGIYGAEIASGLRLAALATIPAALMLHVQTTLVGIGLSHRMGHLNLIENVSGSVVAMGCLLSGMNAIPLIIVFVTCRWIVAILALVVLARL